MSRKFIGNPVTGNDPIAKANGYVVSNYHATMKWRGWKRSGRVWKPSYGKVRFRGLKLKIIPKKFCSAGRNLQALIINKIWSKSIILSSFGMFLGNKKMHLVLRMRPSVWDLWYSWRTYSENWSKLQIKFGKPRKGNTTLLGYVKITAWESWDTLKRRNGKAEVPGHLGFRNKSIQINWSLDNSLI